MGVLRSRKFEAAFFLLGIALFAWLAQRFGWSTLVDAVQLAGWGLLAVVAQEILAHLLNTLGWYFAFARTSRHPPFSSMLLARIAGDAANYLTPTATLGGEFVRLQLLRDAAHGRELVASLAVAKLAQSAGQVVFIAAGALVLLPALALDAKWWWTIAATIALMAVALAVLLWWQRRGMFTSLGGWLGRANPLARERWDRRLAVLDAEVSRVYQEAGLRMPLSVLAFALGWAAGVIEMYLILWCLGLPASWSLALAIEVLSVTVDGLLFFIPAKMGAQEGGKALIFALLGLDPSRGFSAGVLRRIRELVWSGVGLGLWWLVRWRNGVQVSAASLG